LLTGQFKGQAFAVGRDQLTSHLDFAGDFSPMGFYRVRPWRVNELNLLGALAAGIIKPEPSREVLFLFKNEEIDHGIISCREAFGCVRD